ncbi:MAG: aminotransferase class I/II-fold pyridoxal phosphate-dependent enzyme [Verrucomicrobia bacterium]|nr:aminotransferase class I/II-fold pyridoxal phosphate-dependent enzyme [Verrucomicrobiota bacterium]
MAASLTALLEERKVSRSARGSQRSLPTEAAPLSFADNDYLGLAREPRVAEAAVRAIRESGTGARAARHLAGPCPEHTRLEKGLAEWKGTEAALVFASGYQTPLGVIPSLVGVKDTVLLERNAHACLFDGARLSGARLRLFARNDAASLMEMLTSCRRLNPEGKMLVVAESLHSMDGDFLDLRSLVTCKNHFGAWLLLDEAHAGGVTGPEGAGWAAEQGCVAEVDVQMGTLGKSLGSAGGFVAARAPVIDHFLNEARTFLFGTAPAPAAMAAAGQALQIIRSAEGASLRRKLQENIQLFSAESPEPKPGPIQTHRCPSNDRTVRSRDFLRATGIEVAAIRPPTVPASTARLRISLSARHSAPDIRRLLDGLARLRDA